MSRMWKLKDAGRVFTVELDSGGDLRRLTVPGVHRVPMEGTIGELEQAGFVEDSLGIEGDDRPPAGRPVVG